MSTAIQHSERHTRGDRLRQQKLEPAGSLQPDDTRNFVHNILRQTPTCGETLDHYTFLETYIMTWALPLLVYKKHIGQKGYCDVRRQLQNKICIANVFPNSTKVARTYLENWIRLLMYVNRVPTLWIWFCGAFLRHGFCRYFSGTPQGWSMLPSTQIVNHKIIHTGSGLHRHRFQHCQQ